MNRRTVIALAAIAAVLVLLLVVLESFDGGSGTEERHLLPDFAAVANDLESLHVTGPGDADGTTIRKEGDRWVVAERDGYPADTAQLRQLVMALAEAGIVEEKTANPEYYDRLGLGDPAEGGNGVKVVATAGAGETTVIFGETAQGENRYARTPASPQTWLVDRDPAIPVSPGEWLAAEVADIGPGDVRRVRIEHADGESVELVKTDPAQANYELPNVPEGRELSYPSVGNGIAGALSALELEDVRRATDAAPATTAIYETFDGLVVTIEVVEAAAPATAEAPAPDAADDAADDAAGRSADATDATDADGAEAEPATEHWLRLSASVSEDTAAPPPADEAPESAEAPPADVATDAAAAADIGAPVGAAEDAGTPAGEDDATGAAAPDAIADGADAEAPETESAQERADALNARWSGWEYRVPDYKQQLVTRRWEDLLAAEEAPEE